MNVRPKTITEENIRQKVYGNGFLDMTSKAQVT